MSDTAVTIADFDYAVTEWIYWFLKEEVTPSLLVLLASALAAFGATIRRQIARRNSQKDIQTVLDVSTRFTDALKSNIWEQTCPYGSGPFCLYAWYQVDGLLLYVGQSKTVQGRADQHLKTQPWALRVGYMAVLARFLTEKEVLEAEKKAIKDMRPLYNVVHAEWL